MLSGLAPSAQAARLAAANAIAAHAPARRLEDLNVMLSPRSCVVKTITSRALHGLFGLSAGFGGMFHAKTAKNRSDKGLTKPNLSRPMISGEKVRGDHMRFLVVLAAAAALSGCATITRGTTDSWTVNSTPPGAAVKTSTGFTCEATPCTFKMSRKDEFDVTVTKTGFKPWTGKVTHEISGAGGAGFLGNALIGGVIGAGVDATSGAMLDVKPNPLNVTLEKDGSAAVAER
jgi:hypothetical protein